MNIFRTHIAKVITPSHRGGIGVGFFFLLSLLFVASCSEDEKDWDPYYDWKARNEAWFRQVADSARTAIADAKAQYGSQWEDSCQWRMYKRLDQAQDFNTGRLDDSICVHIIKRGTGTYSPLWSDSVRVSHRGWTMTTMYKTTNDNGETVDSVMQKVFDQSYYGPFSELTAAPSLWATSGFVTGFTTAVQYMVEGDDWYVYVPARLAYKDKKKGDIPANSTLLWRIHMAAVYPCASGVPDWQ